MKTKEIYTWTGTLYLVTLFQVSLHGVFDVLLTDSSDAFQAHDVVEDEWVILACNPFLDLMCFVLLKECNCISDIG